MAQIDLAGEVGFTRYTTADGRFSFPVSRPGLEMLVEVDLAARTVTVSRRATTLWEAFAYLHKMPGPHNAAIRGNWIGTQIWRPFADATIYLLLFISISGLYLWWAIRAERLIGLTFLTAGAATLFGLVYVAVR
jgi:hypothetical protein